MNWVDWVLEQTGASALTGSTPQDEQACDTMTVSRAQISLGIPDGEVVSGAAVRYELDDGSGGVTEADCDEWQPGEYVCGYEISGELRISIAAEGFEDAEHTVEVGLTDDECHVETVMETLTLTALDCADDAQRWALLVTVTVLALVVPLAAILFTRLAGLRSA